MERLSNGLPKRQTKSVSNKRVPSHKKDKVGTVTHEKDTEMGEAGSDDSDHGS